MKQQEKIELIKQKDFRKWVDTWKIVKDELSDKQTFVCVCGRLATGFHEINCRKFKNKVESETVKRLKDLLK